MSLTTEPANAIFPTTEVQFGDSRITVPCQPIAPGLAITALIADDREGPDDPPNLILGGGFSITHTTTGRCMPGGQACIECARVAAATFARMSIDWSAIDESGAQTLVADLQAAGSEDYQLLLKAVRIFRTCGQRCCFHDDEESK